MAAELPALGQHAARGFRGEVATYLHELGKKRHPVPGVPFGGEAVQRQPAGHTGGEDGEGSADGDDLVVVGAPHHDVRAAWVVRGDGDRHELGFVGHGLP